MNFIPTEQEAQEVPYFEDVSGEGGWQGHATGKSLATLITEVSSSIARLGGIVTGFQRGTFAFGDKTRDGYRIGYFIEAPNGNTMPGRLDIAALPVRKDTRRRKSHESYREKSLRMALYMLRNALDGLWFLRQLSPGYAPLMPWMLDYHTDKTITELWSETRIMSNLLPRGEEFTEGKFE